MAVGIQETDGQSAVDSGAEYYWGPRAIDSGLKMDSKEELSAQLNLETNPGRNPQDRPNQIGPEVPFFMDKDGKKKKKEKREVEVKPLECHPKRSRSQRKRDMIAQKSLKRDLIAQKSFLLICGAETVESQIVTLTKLCMLLRQRWLPLGGEVTPTTPSRPIDSSTLLGKLAQSKKMAILMVKPLLEETAKICSDLTCRQFQSTIQQMSLVGWEDFIPTRTGYDHSGQSLMEVTKKTMDRGPEEIHVLDNHIGFGRRDGQEDD